MSQRNIIAIGKTGFGKSFILSRILGQKDSDKSIFVSKNAIESTTEEIVSQTRQVSISSENNTLTLTAFDTPGIADSKGRTRQFLDQIMTTIQHQQLHQILIFVKYGRYDMNLQNNFKVLNLCMNGLNTANCMLIINEVPKEKRFKKENPDKSLDEELSKLQSNISSALMTTFSHSFAIEYTEDPDNSELFQQQMSAIRLAILNTTHVFLNSQCQTWSKMISFYTDVVSRIEKDEEARQNAINSQIRNLRDTVNKLLVDIETHKRDIANEKSRNTKKSGLFGKIAPALTVVMPPVGAPLWAASAYGDNKELRATGNLIHDLERLVESKQQAVEGLRVKLVNCEHTDAKERDEFIRDLTNKKKEITSLEELVK